MPKNLINSLIIFCLVSVLIGCATIIKGTNQNIAINSSPSQANFVVKERGGVEVTSGTTPGTVKLKKKKEYNVTISLQGYKDVTVPISQEFEAWYIGNLLCGGIIGLIVDAVDGAMWKLEPDQIQVTLATAMLDNHQKRLYAVFHALDSEGQLRSLAIPLVPDNIYSSN